MEVFRSRYLLVDHDLVTRIVSIRRTSQPWDTIRTCETVHDEVCQQIERIGRGNISILFDARAAPTTSDKALDRTLQSCGARMLRGVERVAFIMKTVVGQAHAERLMRGEGVTIRAFLSETDATLYLTSPTPGRR